MDEQVREFIELTMNSVVGLDVVLFYRDNPDALESVHGIALRTSRKPEEIASCLPLLTEHGVLEAFKQGGECHHCYGLSKRPDVWDLVWRLSDEYRRQPGSRKEIVRLLMRLAAERTGQQQ